MTTEEKLEHFQTLCFQDAKERSKKMLSDYSQSLEQILKEHKKDARRQADMLIEAEKEKLKRDMNKRLSIEQIRMRREYNQKQEELKSMIINELRNRLALFMETPDYQKLLEHQVEQALKVAAGEPVTIYLDPADAEMLNRIALHTKAQLLLSDYSFLGGSRAVIPSKNILIDHSFQTKLQEAEENFQFRLGGI